MASSICEDSVEIDSERCSQVCGIVVETKLDSEQVTVPLRMVGDFPLIMESTGSDSVLQHGKFLRPIIDKVKNEEIIEVRSMPQPKEEVKMTFKSTSRKSHHEYINVGTFERPPPLPPRKGNIVATNRDEELDSIHHDVEGGIHHLLKHMKMLEQRNFLLEETNRKLRKENGMLNHQLQEVMKLKSKESEMLKQHRGSKDVIAKYDCTEIQSLLCKMELPQYVTIFAKEQINGKIFLELDEVILEIELGLYSSLHRKRLMHVVRGSHHVLDIMNNDEERTLV